MLFEGLTPDAEGGSLRAHQDVLLQLAAAYKAINAPLGELGLRSLTGISTSALKGNDAIYNLLDTQIKSITQQRNQIAGQMITMLEAAAFKNTPINEAATVELINQAHALTAAVP